MLVAQTIHAAGESSPGSLPSGTFAIALAVADEPALTREAERLRARGVSFVEVREDDAPYDGALMALGLMPGRREDLRRHVSSLPTLK
jgi:hypothetical protein